MSISLPAAEAQPSGGTTGGRRRGRGDTALRAPFVAERCATLEEFLARAARLYGPASLPFHAPSWLQAWYRTFGAEPGCRPLWVAVRRRGVSGDAALLPLVARRRAGLSVVEFADDGVVDYVAPILAEGWSDGLTPQGAAHAFWRALRRVLRNHDALVVHKLLPRLMEEAGGGINPLALALHTRPCEMFGNQFVVAAATAAEAAEARDDDDARPGGAWERWRRTLAKRTRMEIERSWRVFHRSPEARFEAVTDTGQALALLEVLETQQHARMRALGQAYRLDEPACRAFYRHVVAAGLHGGTPDGPVVMTALRDGEHVVSALFGLANGHRYLGLRQSLGGDAWKACSPARLLDERTARLLHAQGRTHFDFGIGDYAHKHALQMEAIALLDGCRALRPRGQAVVAAWRLRAWLKQRPALRAAWRRWRDRRASPPVAATATAASPVPPSSPPSDDARAD